LNSESSSTDSRLSTGSSEDEIMEAELTPEDASSVHRASLAPDDSWDESMEDPAESSVDDSRPPTSAPTTNEPSTAAPTDSPASIQKEEQASASYEFETGKATEPTPLEIFRLEIATSAFYLGVFSEAFRDNADTTFTNFVAKVDELTFSPDAIPPIEIGWSFEVSYAATSAVIPTSEENLELIYGDEETLNEYVDIYLKSSNDVWSYVSTVSFQEASTEGNADPTTPLESESIFPRTNVEASLQLEFNPGSVEEPTQEEYERLVNALSLFYTALLAQSYSNLDDTTLATVTANLVEVFFEDEADSSSLQANLEFTVFFSEETSSVPTSSSILAIMRENSDALLRFLEEYASWQEDDAWNEVSNLTIGPLFSR
jgi:hypothetical protein